jgi:uncharacterized protein YggU (UPF0235/DUF167 family)
VDGAANKRVIEVLAAALGVRGQAITIVRGEAARHKEVRITGLSDADVRARLAASPTNDQG